MAAVKSILYDETASGRKVITFPPALPFSSALEKVTRYAPQGQQRDALVRIAGVRNVFERTAALAEHIAGSPEPHREVLAAAALASAMDVAGLRLLFAALLAVPPVEVLLGELAGFRNVRRVMDHVERRERSGKGLKESEEWFKKKALLLSMSLPLPNASATLPERPWLGWSDGIRMAMQSAEDRWEQAILERIRVELEAKEHRLKTITASLDPESHQRRVMSLLNMHEETSWRRQIVEEGGQGGAGSSLVLLRKLGDRWSEIASSLRRDEAGSRLVDLIETQARKSHTYPQLKVGTAVVRSIVTHPVLSTSTRKIDLASSLALFVASAGNGFVDFVVPIGKKIPEILEIPGFELHDRVLSVDLGGVPTAQFVDADEAPVDLDWTDLQSGSKLGYRALVLSYMDNDNFLMELLNNPKATAKPGVISLIALRCRSSRILSVIANRRDLYTGFANKDVPLNLLKNPARVPLTSLRKFVHVRYIDKMTLQQLASHGSQIREDVRREVVHYLSSVK